MKSNALHTVTPSEARERFPDLLHRVEGHGESFRIARHGQAVAELSPPRHRESTLASLLEAVSQLPPVDDDFGRDLEANRREQPPLPEDPWAS